MRNAAKRLNKVRTKQESFDVTTWKSLETLAKAISVDRWRQQFDWRGFKIEWKVRKGRQGI